MTADEFKHATGRDPEQDDLERVNCQESGVGHMTCGWCHTHRQPIFQCSHVCWLRPRTQMLTD